MKRLWSILPEL